MPDTTEILGDYSEGKRCERCDMAIPNIFQNLLCNACYIKYVEEREKHDAEVAAQREAERLKNPDSPTHPSRTETIEPVAASSEPTADAVPPQTQEMCDHSTCGISDPNYKENPEQSDKDQILANLAQFVYTHRDADHPKGKKHGILLYYPQRNMYNYIKNYCMKKATSHPQYPKYIWKPKIVDVGCGSGVGANIMSQEADMVWGIDKNEFSIEFAKEAFTREKNGEYYSGQLTFDAIDPFADTRTFMAFDIVVAIEIIEHVWDVNGFLNQLKRFTKKDKKGNVISDSNQATEFFISTPNRNNPKIRKDRPENIFHVREWSAEEYKALLSRHFQNVELMNDRGEPVPDNAIDQVILAKCSVPR